VDRGIAAESVSKCACRHCFFVRAPAELGGLEAFGEKALDRPGIHEFSPRLGIARALRVALRDVDALDTGALHQPRPVLARRRLDEVELELAANVDQRLLYHPRNHAGIGAAAAHGGEPAGAPPPQICAAL